jgi:hypothetical protein
MRVNALSFSLALGVASLGLAAGKTPSATQLQVQLKKLTAERDELKMRLAAVDAVQQELVSAQKARDLAKADADASKQELNALRASLKENQGSGDGLLKDLRTARAELKDAKFDVARLQKENAELKQKYSGAPQEGALVILSDDIQPARPINLNRVTPKVKGGWGRPKGSVVVNVLVNERGEVTAARLIQGFSGESTEIKEAHDACLEAAKKIVFDPARTKENTRVQVWQGVGFYLD